MEKLGIYKAVAGVIADIGAVGKDKVNKQQGFEYRSVDDVYSVLNPALAKNKIFILPEILDQKREMRTNKREIYASMGKDQAGVESAPRI